MSAGISGLGRADTQIKSREDETDCRGNGLLNTMPNITVILTKLEDMVIGIVTRWARNCWNEKRRNRRKSLEERKNGWRGMIWETTRDRRCKKKLNFNNHA